MNVEDEGDCFKIKDKEFSKVTKEYKNIISTAFCQVRHKLDSTYLLTKDMDIVNSVISFVTNKEPSTPVKRREVTVRTRRRKVDSILFLNPKTRVSSVRFVYSE